MGPWQRVVKSTSDLLLSSIPHQRLHYSYASLLSHHTRLLLFSLFFNFHIGFLGLVSFFFFFFFFFHSFSLGFWAWFLFFLSFFLHFSRSFLISFFPLLVLSKLYSVICCGVEGVGGVNGRICYGGLI